MSLIEERFGTTTDIIKEQLEQAMLSKNIEQLVSLQDKYVKPLLGDEDLYDYVDTAICLYYLAYEGMIKEQSTTGRIIFLEDYKSIEEFKEAYDNIKEKLRRMDYLKSEESRTIAVSSIKEAALSDHMVIAIIGRTFHDLGNVYTQLALGFYESGDINRIVPYMEAAISLNPEDSRGDVMLSAGEAGIIIDLLEKFDEKEMSAQLRQYQSNVADKRRSSEVGFFEKIRNFDFYDGMRNSIEPTSFSFIICVSDERQYEQALWYIDRLTIPDGCSVNVIPVRGAKSMCAGYNEGVRQANAEFGGNQIKIFIHQDVFLYNPEFLYYLLGVKEYYSNDKLGLLGVCGTVQMPENGIWWEANRVSARGGYSEDRVLFPKVLVDNSDGLMYEEVECVDGICLVTFEDIPFREDLFDNWHFYDVSACMEYHRAGYKVAVIRDGDQMLLHQCKFNNFNEDSEKIYERNREVFLREYSEDIKRYSIV